MPVKLLLVLLLLEGSAGTAELLWEKNHSSQVKSVVTGLLPRSPSARAQPVLVTGSQFTSDEDVEAIHARTGELFWSSTALAEWTYAVALQPVVALGSYHATNATSTPAATLQRGVAAFGCPYGCPSCPPAPCELGFWGDAGSADSAPNWKMTIPNSTNGDNPPTVDFSEDGRSLIVKYHGEQAFEGKALEYVSIVSVSDPTTVPIQTILLDWGYGHSLQVPRRALQDPSVPPTAAAPSPTAVLVTRNNVSTNFNQHFVMHYDTAPGSPIKIAEGPIIDCNGTSQCSIWAHSADMGLVLVDIAPNGGATLCPAQASWGVALLRGVVADPPSKHSDVADGWPFGQYETLWHQCSETGGDNRKLISANIVGSDRVVLSFALMQGQSATGMEACAYAVAGNISGTELWCTDASTITPPVALPSTPTAQGYAGHIAVAIPAHGIMFLDGNSSSKPTLQMIYSQSDKDDCCVPTALEIVAEYNTGYGQRQAVAAVTVVASIPRGTVDGIWCRCYGSKLVGVAAAVAPAPSPVPPHGGLWRCENSSCVAASSGVSQQECAELCGGYICEQNQCVQVSTGGGSRTECDKMCGPT